MSEVADVLDRFLLLLVVIAAALDAAFPDPGRHANAGGAILVTLAVLVFCTGASLTLTQIAAVRTSWRRLVLVLAVSTVTLPALAWLASRLVDGPAVRDGVLAAGVAPAEVASVALTGLAGGEAALSAGLLVASTILTVVLAGPILGLLGARSPASQAGLLLTLALVVYGNPLRLGAQVLSVGELECGERTGFSQRQRGVGLVVPVEVFFDAQESVGLNVTWRHEQGCELRDHGAGTREEGEAVPVKVTPVPAAVVSDPRQTTEDVEVITQRVDDH